MNDYVDYWILNGQTVYLRDYARGQPNGPAMLDPEGHLLASNINVNYIPAPTGNDNLTNWILATLA